MPTVQLDLLARVTALVGLDLSVRTFPGGHPLRDHAHLELLLSFRARLHPSLRWSTEVPLPSQGDPRAWDGMVRGVGWRYGVEAETAPNDWQALSRRIELKKRDGMVDGVILLLPETRRTRLFLEAAQKVIPGLFPVPPRRILGRLGEGLDPGGSGIAVLRQVRSSQADERPSPKDLLVE
jgi:hypothetical protein